MASRAPTPGFTLAELAPLAKLRVQAMPGARATALASGQLPQTPNTVHGANPWTLWLGPHEWLVYATAASVGELEKPFAADIAAGTLVCADTSSGLTLLELEGPRSVEMLSAGSGLDFQGGALAADACAQTQLFQIPLIIHRPDVRLLWRLFVERSLARWARAALNDQGSG